MSLHQATALFVINVQILVTRESPGHPAKVFLDATHDVRQMRLGDESFGSWMALVDWNDRGVLDILVGTFDGMMFLRRNEGTRTKPVYSDKNEWVMAGNKRLRVPGGAHANPVIAIPHSRVEEPPGLFFLASAGNLC